MSNLFRVGLENAVAASVLALVAFVASKFLKRSPALVHAFLLLVLLKLVTPPFWSFPVLPRSEPLSIVETLEIRSEAQRSTEFVANDLGLTSFETVQLYGAPIDLVDDAQASEALITTKNLLDDAFTESIDEVEATTPPIGSIGTSEVLMAAWLAGSVVTLAYSIRAIRRFTKVLELAKPASPAIQDQVEDAAARIGLAQIPETFLIDWDRPPMVWAIGRRPSLMIPNALWSRLDAFQRETLLIHELAHLKRGDHLVRWLELAVSVLFWWLPAVWWTRRALREAEEDCCDAWVIWALPKSARCYADTLVETVDFLSESRTGAPLLASGFGHVRHLKRRLRMIMQGKTIRRMGLREALALLAMGAAFLTLNPSWADPQDPPKEVEPVAPKSADAVATTPKVVITEDRQEKDGTVTITRRVTTTSDDDGDGEKDIEVTTTVEPPTPAAPPVPPVSPIEPAAAPAAIAPVPPAPPAPPTEIFFRGEVGSSKGRKGGENSKPAVVGWKGNIITGDEVLAATIKRLENQVKLLTNNPDEKNKDRQQRRITALKKAIETLQGELKEPLGETKVEHKARVLLKRGTDSKSSSSDLKDAKLSGDVYVEGVGESTIVSDRVLLQVMPNDEDIRLVVKDPGRAAAVQDELSNTVRKLAEARRLARDPSEPTVRKLEQQIIRLVAQLDAKTLNQVKRDVPSDDRIKQQEDRLSAMERTLEKVLGELQSLKKEKSNSDRQ